jgi:hypothetical protein
MFVNADRSSSLQNARIPLKILATRLNRMQLRTGAGRKGIRIIEQTQ